MIIALGPDGSVDLTGIVYSELVQMIGDWLDREDLAARSAMFIRLAEARLNRLLDDPNMEVRLSDTSYEEGVPLPEDFGAVVSITTGNGELRAMGAGEMAAYPANSGLPRAYGIVNGSLYFAPRNASTPYTLVYRRRIPPLTAESPINWLISLAPDVYLYGALLQASGFLAEDSRIPLWKAAFDEAISELVTDGARRKWGSGPIAPRIRRA